jgi:hypothetical protein
VQLAAVALGILVFLAIFVVLVSSAWWAIDDIRALPEWAFRQASPLSQPAWVAFVVLAFFFFGPLYLVVLWAWFRRAKPQVAAAITRRENAAALGRL